MINKTTLKQRLERHPRLYLRMLNLKRFGHWSRSWIVTPKTDITIEGYPRCGNSFARSAFQAAQDRDFLIATHVHSYAQVLRSVELKKPTMVLVRQPRDACLSLVALTYEIERADLSRENLLRARKALKASFLDFQEFYRNVVKVKDEVIFADFNLVTSDYGEVLHRMNRRFGTDYQLYRNTEENDGEVFSSSGFHLSPNEGRNAIKSFLAECLEDSSVQALADQANGIYEHVLTIEREQARLYGSGTQG